jgi:hypothetical protein
MLLRKLFSFNINFTEIFVSIDIKPTAIDWISNVVNNTNRIHVKINLKYQISFIFRFMFYTFVSTTRNFVFTLAAFPWKQDWNEWVSDIWCSRGGEVTSPQSTIVVNCGLECCDTLQPCMCLLMFQRNILPPSSESRIRYHKSEWCVLFETMPEIKIWSSYNSVQFQNWRSHSNEQNNNNNWSKNTRSLKGMWRAE